MKIYAAIDLLDGRVVRLKEGCFSRTTQYADSPLEAAKFLKDQGAQRVHMVNLKGALQGNREAGLSKADGLGSFIPALQNMGLEIQFGGGIRTLDDCNYLVSLGVTDLILGTAAIEHKRFLESALSKYGGKLTVALDVKNGKPALKGWTQTTDLSISELCSYLNEIGVERMIYTDVSRDGLLEGPNLEGLKEIDKLFVGRRGLVASGGITTIKDVEAIASLGIKEAIIGCAVYEKRISLQEAEAV